MTVRFIQTVILLCLTSFGNAQVSQNMSLLGNWNPGNFPTAGSLMYNDIWGYADCAGNEYAIMGGAAFYHFINITNPSNPVEVTSIAGGNTTIWRDMKTYSKYAYGVCDSCSEGLSVFDLGDLPNSVTMVGQYTSSFSRAHNIFIDEATARLYAVGTDTQSGGVIVFDLAANPENPPEIGRMSLPGGYIHDMMVRNHIGYAHSGNNGMYVYDFTNLSNVTTLGSLTGYTPSGYNHAGWPTDDLQGYVFADETHNRDLKYCDISDLSDMSITTLFRSELLAPAVTGSVAHNPFIRDNYAIVSYYHDGLQIFDISDPNNIIQAAWYDTYTNHTNYSGFGGNWGAYPYLPSGNILASDEFTGLYILNPTNITFTPIPTPSPPTVSISAAGSTIFCAGETVPLNATFTGSSVQWYKDGVSIPGETGSVFVATESGAYSAQTLNGSCSANSSTITVTVNPNPDVTLNVGANNQICDTENLQIIAPPGEPSYEWTLNGNVFAQNTNSINATIAGNYQVEISNGTCSAMSIVVNVTVETTPDATMNVSGNQEICEGNILILSIPTGADVYSWTKDSAPFGNNSNSITVVESGDYQVLVSTGNCTDISEIINVSTVVAPDVTLNNNGPIQLCNGESMILEIEPFADNYTWYKDQTIVVGTSNIINVFETGNYHVEASNGDCTATSQIVVVDVGVDPDMTLNVPLQNALCAGDLLELEIPAGASNYTWYYNNVAQNNANAPNFFASNAGDYYVIADLNGCEATSETVNIIFETFPDVNLNVGSFNEICEGDDLVISAASGADSYEWYRDGVLFANSGNVEIVNEPGDYYLVASNGNCESTSATTTVVVLSTPDATLNMTGVVEICDGEAAMLSVPAGAQNYNWSFNGNQNVSNSNTINAVQAGDYQVIVSNGNCESTSAVVTVNVNQNPSAELNVPLQNELCDGEVLDINVPSGANTYQWFLNGNLLANTTNALTATAAGNYQVIAANGNCETMSETVNLTLNATPSVALDVPTVNQICEGDELTISIPTGASSYDWFENGNPISNSTNTLTVNSAGMYSVTAGNGTCEATSEMVEITVNTYPEATLNVPLQNNICTGETLELVVPTGAQTYEWFQNGNLLSQNGNSITASTSGNYQVIVKNGDCAATSEMATVTVTAFPNVDLSMPLQNEICEGETLPISVATGAMSYQWFFNGNPIAMTAEIMATEAGTYTVTASNGNCEATSEILNLTVNTFPDATLDGETENFICQGESVTISVATGAQTYEWFQNGNLLSQNGNSITASISGDYQVQVSNGGCETVSEMVNVEVFDYPNATITVPTQNNLCDGETLTISIPTGAQNYEWYQDGELMTTDEASITVSEAGDYYAVAMNGDCATTSETINVTVTAVPNVDLSVGSMNQICENDQITIEVAGNAQGYQWFQNGELLPISGNMLTVSEGGEYQVIANNGNCVATSQITTVEVVDAPDAALNVETNNEICTGENLLLEVMAGASNYQWFLNGEMTGNNGNTLSATETGEYFVMVGTGDCSSMSEIINLTVTPTPDVALNVGAENFVCAGEMLTLLVDDGAENYTWYFNNQILLSGSNNEINVSQSGDYYVEANNANCAVTSEIINISIVPLPNPSLNIGSQTMICEGEEISVTAPESNGSLAWFLNDELVSTDTVLTTSQAGTYYVEITENNCTVTSSSFEVNVTPLPTPELAQAGEQSVCEGFAFSMNVNTDADSFEWYYNGDGLGNNGTTFIVSEPGEYYVVAETNGCEGTSESVFLTVNPFPDADIQTTAVQICPNETAILSTPSNGDSYQWFYEFQPINGATDTIIEVSEAGTYFVSVTSNGCSSVSVNLPINIFVPVTPEITFDGEELIATPANTYQWLLDGVPISGATEASYVPTENGDYTIQTTDDNGCEATSEPLNILLDAVQDFTLSNGFLVYPNPVVNALFLENQSNEMVDSRLVIFNNIGVTIFEKQLTIGAAVTETINVDDWAVGVYYLKVETTDGRFFVRKFVKEQFAFFRL